MRAILPLAVFVHAAQALKFTLPHRSVTPGPFTITYISNASDPAGNMTFWYGHANGNVALIAAQNDMHTKTPKQLQVNISEAAADGSQYQFKASPMGGECVLFSSRTVIQPASSSATPTGSTSPSAPALSAASSPASIAATQTPLASTVATPSADSECVFTSKAPISASPSLKCTQHAAQVVALRRPHRRRRTCGHCRPRNRAQHSPALRPEASPGAPPREGARHRARLGEFAG
ncbi:hypothetical protein GGX14DRAFT_453689 [Mycena pura]|uniref:Uncharacterized protein n=1 Tax=Mycena pura TaxID=153505 RepID=A0AAD6VEH5_9AGAR|nr:hypothetical protein GGX14DRAFT_453689 [Mycena pura]